MVFTGESHHCRVSEGWCEMDFATIDRASFPTWVGAQCVALQSQLTWNCWRSFKVFPSQFLKHMRRCPWPARLREHWHGKFSESPCCSLYVRRVCCGFFELPLPAEFEFAGVDFLPGSLCRCERPESTPPHHLSCKLAEGLAPENTMSSVGQTQRTPLLLASL